MLLLCLVFLQRHWTRVTQLIWMPLWLTCAPLSRSSTPFPNQILLLAATAKDNSEPLGATVPVPSTQAPVEGGAVEVQNNTYCILYILCCHSSVPNFFFCQGRFCIYISGNSTKIHSLWLKNYLICYDCHCLRAFCHTFGQYFFLAAHCGTQFGLDMLCNTMNGRINRSQQETSLREPESPVFTIN